MKDTTREMREKSIDTRASEIATDACRGNIDEHEARLQIMALVGLAEIDQFVVHSMSSIHPWERDEVSTSVRDNMLDRILDDNGLNLKEVQTSSVTGWARKDAYRKANWSVGELRRRQKLIESPGELPEKGVPESEDQDIHDAFLDIVDGFETKAKGTRDKTRGIIAARTLMDAFRLPNLVLPETWEDRDWIAQQILLDPSIPYLSVLAFRRIIEGEATEHDMMIDQRILSLWDDYSYEEIDRLSGKPSGVSYRIVLTGVSRKPRPGRNTVASAVELISLSGDGEGWHEYVVDVVKTWLDRTCEALSEFTTSVTLIDIATARARAAERARRWESVVLEGKRYGFPMGSDSASVDKFVTEVIETVSAYPLS